VHEGDPFPEMMRSTVKYSLLGHGQDRSLLTMRRFFRIILFTWVLVGARDDRAPNTGPLDESITKEYKDVMCNRNKGAQCCIDLNVLVDGWHEHQRRTEMANGVKGWIVGAVVVMLMALGFHGCKSAQRSLGLESEPPPPPSPKYYDFPDVLIPEELKLDSGESVIYEYGGHKMGMLHFTGGVEVQSLVDFFSDYMTREGWNLVNSVKFKARTMLNFVKEERICQILVVDKTMTTEVEVWVNPLKSM
jgi:hypothetical protein